VTQTSGPYSPVLGSAIQARSPLQGSGNVQSIAAVVKNVSPYLLEVSSGAGSLVGLVDPYTTDVVALDPEAGQQLSILPTGIGLVPPQTVSSQVWVTWYQSGEQVPGAYPYALPLSSQISIGGLSYQTVSNPSGPAQLVPAPASGYSTRIQSIGCEAEGTLDGYLLFQYHSTSSPFAIMGSVYDSASATFKIFETLVLAGLLIGEQIDVQSAGSWGVLKAWINYDTVLV
jgi:hypothetical protein